LLKEGLVDYVAMDIKTDPFCYAPTIRKQFDPSELLTAIGLIMEQAPAYEFRTTCVPSLIDERIVAAIARLINGAELYALQHFQGACVLHPEFFQPNPQPFDDETLERFRHIAAPHVKRCILR
jgi:pyruvate formate lyase activating enzyme